MKTKHGFNLIEITLAIAIIAFGMSSILVLFQQGMTTTTDAVADSVVPDTADYVLSYWQAMVDVGWRDEHGALRTENEVLKNLGDSKPDATAADPDKNLTFKPISTNSTNLFRAEGKKGIYKYEQSYYPTATEDLDEKDKVVDFSAIVLVWKEPHTYLYHGSDSPVKFDTDQAATLCIEISYPATLPYEKRETQFYRLELYSQAWKTEGM